MPFKVCTLLFSFFFWGGKGGGGRGDNSATFFLVSHLIKINSYREEFASDKARNLLLWRANSYLKSRPHYKRILLVTKVKFDYMLDNHGGVPIYFQLFSLSKVFIPSLHSFHGNLVITFPLGWITG